MKYKHFALIPFTGLGLHNGYRGDRWLRNRIEIFKNYTLQSILNQTDKENLVLWFAWRPEEKENQIVKNFNEYLWKFLRIDYIFKFLM